MKQQILKVFRISMIAFSISFLASLSLTVLIQEREAVPALQAEESLPENSGSL